VASSIADIFFSKNSKNVTRKTEISATQPDQHSLSVQIRTRPVCCKVSSQSLGFYDTSIIFVHNNNNNNNNNIFKQCSPVTCTFAKLLGPPDIPVRAAIWTSIHTHHVSLHGSYQYTAAVNSSTVYIISHF